MKLLFTILSVAVVVSVLGQMPSETRIVRLMLSSTNSFYWRIRVNQDKETVVSSDNITTRLEALKLHHGDLIILGSRPNSEFGSLAETWRSVSRSFHSNNVAIYRYGAYATNVGASIFSIPVYHWVAPYDDPLSMESSSFYFEGHFLGRSTNGFNSMLVDLHVSHPQKVFILGSLYDTSRSFPPLPCPFERERERLEAVLSGARIDWIELDLEL
jgi:hypothetical protein